MVTFVKHFRHYLWERKFLIRTDHSSLKWLKKIKNPEGVVARWIAPLDTYYFEITYRKGRQHGDSDALSRKPYRKCNRASCQECGNGEFTGVITREQAKAQERSRVAEDGENTQRKSAPPGNGEVSPTLSQNCHEEWSSKGGGADARYGESA